MKAFFNKLFGKKKAKKAVELYRKLKRKPFKETKLPNIDDFFSKIQAPMDTICDLSDAIGEADEGILSLCDSEEELKNAKVQKNIRSVIKFMVKEGKKDEHDFRIVISESGVPSLECKKEPQGVLGKIFEGLKKLVDAIKEVIEKSPELISQLQEGAQACKEFPNKIQSDAATAGLNPIQTAKAAKDLSENIKYLAAFPNDVIEFIKNIKELVKILQDIFEGKDVEEAEEEEKEEKKEGKKEKKKEKKEEKKGEKKEEKEEGKEEEKEEKEEKNQDD